VQIDWFTLLAQIINFLILLYLLKRFLYGPIIETMDRREQNIVARLDEADQKRREAEEQKEHYRHQRQELEETRERELSKAREEVEARRKEMLAEAQQEVERKKHDWQDALVQDRENFLKELRRQMGQEAGEIARRALRDMANVDVERRMADTFVTRLQALEPGERDNIRESIRKSNGRVTIRSAYELPADVQEMLVEGVEEHISADDNLTVRFETASDLVSGIEMRAHGHLVAWTLEAYIDGLETEIRRMIDRETQEGRVNGSE
jgi:F-type H+-transporting ATPase subunit b